MDDSCAVCADALEWVAYGPCRHREVCSTCVVRLRFVLEDSRCCICKTNCPSVFITKCWYHEDTQAYFDDADHYKMTRAMCRLSCSVCDKAEDLVRQHKQSAEAGSGALNI